MNAAASSARPVRDWFRLWLDGWDRFWFTPEAPHTLALLRILSGSMLFYTHLIWALHSDAFFGPDSWTTAETSRALGGYVWSHLYGITSPGLLAALHAAALVVFAMLVIGWQTRIVSVLACLLTLSYCHRLHGALFGLDQVNAMMAMYLAVGPCGAVYSLDHWWKRRRDASYEPSPSVSGNIAIRLIQLHLCVIYLFGGIGKMRGLEWWDGSAVWTAIANLEYQSWDMLWMVEHVWLIALLSHITILWETFYCALVWPKATRPVVLSIAVGVHGGIAMFLGMITFGLAMIFANLAFVPACWVRRGGERLQAVFKTRQAETGR